MARGIRMNKLLISGAFLTVVLMASASYAQDAAAPADNSGSSEPADQIPVVTTPTPVSISVPGEDPTAKILREGVPLRVRQEQGFDANGNNRLEPDEIRAFCKSVYEDTAHEPVKNTSDILYPFDKNKDGYIDRSEASSLPR